MGSNARGCVYFISSDGMENVTGTIARNNSAGVTVELASVTYKTLAYDWENDNSIGTLPVRVDSDYSSIEICPTITTTSGTDQSTSELVNVFNIYLLLSSFSSDF